MQAMWHWVAGLQRLVAGPSRLCMVVDNDCFTRLAEAHANLRHMGMGFDAAFRRDSALL
jgi:hypothetical protein